MIGTYTTVDSILVISCTDTKTNGNICFDLINNLNIFRCNIYN